MRKLSQISALLLGLWLTTTFASSIAVGAQATPINRLALCGQTLKSIGLDLPDRHDHDGEKFVSIALNPQMTRAQFKRAVERLEKEGFTSSGKPQFGYDLSGFLPAEIDLKSLSLLSGVVSVRRESAEQAEIWKNGRKRIKDPSDESFLDDKELWSSLRNPIDGFPTRNLNEIRALARSKGVTIVVSSHRPARDADVKALEELYGAQIFFAEDLSENSQIVKLPGLVLHMQPSVKSLLVRGEISLLIGRGKMFARLNKVTEAEWILSVDKKAMAASVRASDLMSDAKDIVFNKLRKDLGTELDRFLASKSTHWGVLKERALTDLITQFFDMTTKVFPEGAFIKWKGDYATRESGQMITSFSTKPSDLAQEMMAELLRINKSVQGPLSFFDPAVGEALSGSSSTLAFVYSLLVRPQDLLVQEKLPLAETPYGSMMEFRVDVFTGHVVNSTFRYGHYEFYPREAQRAKLFVENFIRKLPEGKKYMTGGFDVAMLEDGSFRIIETNPGIQSSFVLADTYPIDANIALSNLLGRPTVMMSKLERLYQEGREVQAQVLKKAPIDVEDKTRLDEIPAIEILLWLRGRAVEDWLKSPTTQHAREALDGFAYLIRNSKPQNGDFQTVYQSLADYFSRELGRPL